VKLQYNKQINITRGFVHDYYTGLTQMRLNKVVLTINNTVEFKLGGPPKPFNGQMTGIFFSNQNNDMSMNVTNFKREFLDPNPV
jgi:hypothetical protein